VGRVALLGRERKAGIAAHTNVNVRINSRERFNVLAVPRGSWKLGGQSFVFVVRASVGKTILEKHPIQVGIADATNYEVVSGLTWDDVVALPGDADFRDGMSVRVVNLDTSNVSGGMVRATNHSCAVLACVMLLASSVVPAQESSLGNARAAFEKASTPRP